MVRAGATTLTTDVPLKLTAAGPAHRLKIELHADQRQWCARATDADGHAPTGALLAAMTARATNTSMQSGTSSSAADAVWAGRFPSNLPTQGELAISVFVGGENYETAKAEMTVSL